MRIDESAISTSIQQEQESNNCSTNHKAFKKGLGQFMTPPDVATYMANRSIESLQKAIIRILEPAAGSGNLVAAVFDNLIKRPKKPERVEFVLYEIDPLMKSSLISLAKRMRNEAKKHNFSVSCSIRIKDFLLNIPRQEFDLIIANPPFFKIRKDDPRAIAHNHVVHGQPNIYGLFMATCVNLLNDSGRYCFLTPRSWTSGSYFSELRKYIFRHLQLDAVHLFQSREATFTEDRIQQETMITWASRHHSSQEEIMVSASDGVSDLVKSVSTLVSIHRVFTEKKEKSVSIPLSSCSNNISTCTDTLLTLGLRASTGKVVPFRATEWITEKVSDNTVPLIWMQHVRRNEIMWPLQRKKEHITFPTGTKKLLIPNENYVLVRRFCPRDNENWVTAAPFLKNGNHELIGIENHVNYIYGVDTPLTSEQTIGLATYLNSSQVSHYLSSRLGHTQINASDLNTLPIPSLDQLSLIGKACDEKAEQSERDAAITLILSRSSLNYQVTRKGSTNEQKAIKESSF